MIRYVSKFAKRLVWKTFQRAGFLIRRDDTMAYPDQSRLLDNLTVKCVFDLGANSGETVEKYLDLFPLATIHAFEPIPEMIERLKKRFSGNPRVCIVAAAVSNQVGTIDFNLNENPDTSSVLKSNIEHVPQSYKEIQNTNEILTVNTVTLDEYCRENDVDFVDVLKLDIQGGELNALQGSSMTLADQKIGVIYTEAFVHPFYQDQPLLGDLSVLLGSHGYVLHNLYNFSFRSTSGRCTWLDAIFVSPKLRSRSLEILNSDLK